MSRACSVVIVAALASSLGGGGALAQDAAPQNAAPQVQPAAPEAAPPQNPAADPVAAMIGAWELSNADHDKVCKLNFRNDAVPGGHELDTDKNCVNVFPSIKDMTAWAVDNFGNLRLVDSQGGPVLELTQVESGMFDGFRPEEGRYILQAAAAVQIRTADDMIGDWAIARGTGKPICLLTLGNAAAAAGAGDLPLKLKPGCDALVTRFGPTAWHMDNGDLVLLAPRGPAWRFEENDANTWQRVPETPDPVLLVRQ
jgi:hypothetical protein